MSVEQGLLEAIRESPDDDTPRLVYADWLTDHGDADRGDFIRVQCRLATLDEYDAERAGLLRREHALLRAHGKRWHRPAAKFASASGCAFRRGFIARVTMAAAKFLDTAAALFAAVPLTDLRPTQVNPHWGDFLASPHLARLRCLDLHFSQLGAGRTEALARCEALANLRELNLGIDKITYRALRTLLASRCLPALERLDLNKNHTGEGALTGLASAAFPRLRHLNLADNALGTGAAATLAGAGWLLPLEGLDLSGNPLGDDCLRVLADSGIWAGLRVLGLRAVRATAEAARILANCPHLANLRDLTLSGDRRPGLLGALARSSVLANLRAVDLIQYGATVGDDEVDALVRSPLAGNLRSLRLRGLSPTGLRTLLAAPTLGGLKRLDLSCHDGTAELAEWVAAADHLAGLTHLNLAACKLGPAGAKAVANSPHLAGLIDLDVAADRLDDDAIEALLASPHLAGLLRLRLGYAPYGMSADLKDRVTGRFGPGALRG